MGQISISVYDNTFNFTVSVTMNVSDNALNNVNAWIVGTAPNTYNVVGANATIYWAEYLWNLTQNAVYAYQTIQATANVAMLPAANLTTITVQGVSQNIANYPPILP